MAQAKVKDKRVALLAGFISGGIEATATWPTEYVKTQLQLQASPKLRGPTASAWSGPRFTGFFDCVRYTVATHGVLGLYRGLAPVVLLSMPKAGVRFAGFETVKTLLKNKDGTVSATSNFVAGASAGVVEAALIVTPQETLKVKLINANRGFVSGTMHVIRTEGIGGIYKGLVPTILKQASNQGVRFFAYNEIMRMLGADEAHGRSPSAMQALLGGMLAGCASVIGEAGRAALARLREQRRSERWATAGERGSASSPPQHAPHPPPPPVRPQRTTPSTSSRRACRAWTRTSTEAPCTACRCCCSGKAPWLSTRAPWRAWDAWCLGRGSSLCRMRPSLRWSPGGFSDAHASVLVDFEGAARAPTGGLGLF